jgi:hypothetical protein
MMVNRGLGSPSQCGGPDRLLMSPWGPGRAKTAGGEVSSGRGCLRFRLQESGVFQLLWRSTARACALSAFRTVEPRFKRHSHSQGYVLIAAISGPGPMMLMTRVRL